MVVKKTKKKKKFGSRAFSSGSKSRGQSPLRPRHVEKEPPCSHICPSGNRIREFLTTIAWAERRGKSTDRAFEEAWRIYTQTSPFPSVCGRVCPHPCQSQCNRKDHDTSVKINLIERAIGDSGLKNNLPLKTLSEQKRPEKIAVVGGGPGGFSSAYQLARRGYGVTVFEASDKRLRWGIPDDRLPPDILDGEIQKILDLGVALKSDLPIGTQMSLPDLSDRYQAIFVSLAAEQRPKTRVEGDQTGQFPPGVVFLDRIPPGETAGVGDDAIAPARVTMAIGRGRLAAEAIDRELSGREESPPEEMPIIRTDRLRLDHYEKSAPAPAAELSPEERLRGLETEVAEPWSQERVISETQRCMSCGYCFDCEKCWLFCQDQAIVKPMEKGRIYSFKMENCTGCNKCAEQCPCGFIDML